MKQKIKRNFSNLNKWYQENLAKIFLLGAVHLLVYLLIKLPYINIVILFFPAVLYFIDIILAIILFKPKKEYIIYTALLLFIVSIPFSMFHLNASTEFLGNISFILLAVYIIQVYLKKN